MDIEQTILITHLVLAISILLPVFMLQFVDLDQPNHLFGYRTKWSMKSDETWRYANIKSASYLKKMSFTTIFIQICTFFLFESTTAILITAGALVLGVMLTMTLIEKGLRENFNKDGSRKTDLDLF